MLDFWHNIGSWLLTILGTTVANLLTFLIFTSITGTAWFKSILTKLTKDFNVIPPFKKPGDK